jgi:hypothetical protein
MTKSKKTVESPKTISVGFIEYYSTSVAREPIEINVEDYAELKGMTEDEMKDYIGSNWSEMAPTNSEWAESLYEECQNSEIRREKITGEEIECYFE